MQELLYFWKALFPAYFRAFAVPRLNEKSLRAHFVVDFFRGQRSNRTRRQGRGVKLKRAACGSIGRFDMAPDKLNILLVDDHPAKLLTYETILQDLGENLINADSARSAFEHLLRHDIAVALLDVCMPELDGFQLASMIREHTRCRNTTIIFVSGIYLSDNDRLRGYELGAVDYVQVPVMPEVLRSKVKIFVELHRKTRQLEQLNRELEDQVENRATTMLSVVQSIVRLTRAEDMESYVAAIDGRIQALAQFHALLSQSRWTGVELEKLIENEFRPYRGEGDTRNRFVAAGQNVVLEPATAQTVALALHELVTNAAKYGALSTPSGRVRLGWDIQPDSIVLRWLENGGPAVERPTRSGFGTRVISAIIEGQPGGAAKFDWLCEGLRCTISIPRPNRTRKIGGRTRSERRG